MNSTNPAFAGDRFAQFDWAESRSSVMTVQGTVAKTFLLLAILSAAAIWSWDYSEKHGLNPALLVGSALGGAVLCFITIFKPTAAPYTSPIYSALEGLFLGALSYFIEQRGYHGIAMQATSLTIATLLLMLVVYGTGLIKVTPKLAAGVIAATGAVALVYMVSILLRMFGYSFPFLYDASAFSIGFSLFVVGLAAFNLLLDFDFIESGARGGAPKSMEWYGAFGLMVTLIWLYLEILRLLRKFSDRR